MNNYDEDEDEDFIIENESIDNIEKVVDYKLLENNKKNLIEDDNLFIKNLKFKVNTIKKEKTENINKKITKAKIYLNKFNNSNKDNREVIKKIRFAGREYYLNENNEIIDNINDNKEIELLNYCKNKNDNLDSNKKDKLNSSIYKDEENIYLKNYISKNNNLKNIISIITNKSKNISAIYKSKIDWNNYLEKDSEDKKKLENNRKDGFLGKLKFKNKIK